MIPVLAAPFDDGERIAEAELGAEVELLCAAGVPAVTFGFATEVHRLTEAERDRALRVACRAAGGRVPVVAHVSVGSAAARSTASGR